MLCFLYDNNKEPLMAANKCLLSAQYCSALCSLLSAAQCYSPLSIAQTTRSCSPGHSPVGTPITCRHVIKVQIFGHGFWLGSPSIKKSQCYGHIYGDFNRGVFFHTGDWRQKLLRKLNFSVIC